MNFKLRKISSNFIHFSYYLDLCFYSGNEENYSHYWYSNNSFLLNINPLGDENLTPIFNFEFDKTLNQISYNFIDDNSNLFYYYTGEELEQKLKNNKKIMYGIEETSTYKYHTILYEILNNVINKKKTINTENCGKTEIKFGFYQNNIDNIDIYNHSLNFWIKIERKDGKLLCHEKNNSDKAEVTNCFIKKGHLYYTKDDEVITHNLEINDDISAIIDSLFSSLVLI